MNMDIIRTLITTSLNNSPDENENESYRNEVESNIFLKNSVESSFDYLQENLWIEKVTDLNLIFHDNNLPLLSSEDNHQEMNFLNCKREREDSIKEKDPNINADKYEENNSIKNKKEEKKEEQVSSLEEDGLNGNKNEEKEIVIEINEKEENSNNIKLKLNYKRLFRIEKIRKEDKDKNTQYGRKKQEDKDMGKNGDHNRDSEDNKIRKIKSFFGKNLYLFINASFSKTKDEFLKLEISINKNLKKDFNEDLFKKKIKDIYKYSEISDKYLHFDKSKNIKLIDKIYKEQEEPALIKILNLTYIEAFDIFRRKIKEEKDIKPELKKKIEGTGFLDNTKFKDFDCFIGKIREEEKKHNNGDLEEYINDIKRLCINFEGWFGQKVGRKRKDNVEKFY